MGGVLPRGVIVPRGVSMEPWFGQRWDWWDWCEGRCGGVLSLGGMLLRLEVQPCGGVLPRGDSPVIALMAARGTGGIIGTTCGEAVEGTERDLDSGADVGVMLEATGVTWVAKCCTGAFLLDAGVQLLQRPS